MPTDQISLAMDDSANTDKGSIKIADLPAECRPALGRLDDGKGNVSVHELYQATDLLKQERRKSSQLCIVLGATFTLLLLSTTANLLGSYYVFEHAKTMTTRTPSAGFSNLVDKNTGALLAAGVSMTRYEMVGRSFQSPYGPSPMHNFTSMQSVQLAFGPAVASFQVSAHFWVNDTLMALYTQTGQTVVIFNGRVTLINRAIPFPPTPSMMEGRRRLQFGEIAIPLVAAAADALTDAVGDAVGSAVADRATTYCANAGVDDTFGEGASRYAGEKVGDYAGQQTKNALQNTYDSSSDSEPPSDSYEGR